MCEGWVCPKCGRALAPWMSECPCYEASNTNTSNWYPLQERKTPIRDFMVKPQMAQEKPLTEFRDDFISKDDLLKVLAEIDGRFKSIVEVEE